MPRPVHKLSALCELLCESHGNLIAVYAQLVKCENDLSKMSKQYAALKSKPVRNLKGKLQFCLSVPDKVMYQVYDGVRFS